MRRITCVLTRVLWLTNQLVDLTVAHLAPSVIRSLEQRQRERASNNQRIHCLHNTTPYTQALTTFTGRAPNRILSDIYLIFGHNLSLFLVFHPTNFHHKEYTELSAVGQ